MELLACSENVDNQHRLYYILRMRQANIAYVLARPCTLPPIRWTAWTPHGGDCSCSDFTETSELPRRLQRCSQRCRTACTRVTQTEAALRSMYILDGGLHGFHVAIHKLRSIYLFGAIPVQEFPMEGF
jgi:hypothetical protein